LRRHSCAAARAESATGVVRAFRETVLFATMLTRFKSCVLLYCAAVCALLFIWACGATQAPKRAPWVATLNEQAPPQTSNTVAVAKVRDPHEQSPLVVTADDPSWGDVDALVTLIEFQDLQCPFCQRVQPVLQQLKALYGPSRLRMVWKNNPLPFHQQALPAHRAAMAVHKLAGNNAFLQFVETAFKHQRELSDKNFVLWAASVGISADALGVTKDGPEVQRKIDDDIQQARQAGATGTPSFRINGLVLNGAQPFDSFSAVIDEQLSAAAAELQAGTPRHQVSLLLTQRNYKAVAEQPEKVQKSAEDTTVWKVPVNAGDPTLGPSDALVTIVEWGDYQCPFCKRVEETLASLRGKYPNDVRIVWKDNALPFHPEAKPAANLARHVLKYRGNAAFWKTHDALFARQADLGSALYEAIAKEHRLDWKVASTAIAKDLYGAEIDADEELARSFQALGTPHFFINGRRLSGAQPFEKFEALIEEQLAIARELVARGTARRKVYAKLMESAQEPPEPERRVAPTLSGTEPSRGSKNARVVIQEFSDFQCPFCQRAQPTLDEVLKKYPRDVRIVFRHMPLAFHEHAQLAAEAAMEAFAQRGDAGFFAYHDLLFQNREALLRSHLEDYAAQTGLDLPRFQRALDERTHRTRVEADAALAQGLDISGTPSFLINDYFLSGAQPLSSFEALIERELKTKKR
jgi:protein-disulfide isomerase